MSSFRFRSALFAAVVFVLGSATFVAGCDNSVDIIIPDADATPAGWTLVWSDEFDGVALDETKWDYQLGTGCPNLCGWGNNELQNYTRENVSVSDGTLKISAREAAADSYTSGRLRGRRPIGSATRWRRRRQQPASWE